MLNFIKPYKDNPFLEQSLVNEIERLKDIDDNYWRVYGLGERGASRSLVFKFQTIDNIPESAKLIGRGLDFGFSNDSTALVETFIEGDDMYCRELLYRTGMTNQDIGNELKRLGLIGGMKFGATQQSRNLLRRFFEWDLMQRKQQRGA